MKFILMCALVATALASPLRQMKLEDLEADLQAENVTPSAKEVTEYAKLVKAREEEVVNAINKIETSEERKNMGKDLDEAVQNALDQQVAEYKVNPAAFEARVHNDSSKLNIVVKPNREMLGLDTADSGAATNTGTVVPGPVVPTVPDNSSEEEGSGEGNSSDQQPEQNVQDSSEETVDQEPIADQVPQEPKEDSGSENGGNVPVNPDGQVVPQVPEGDQVEETTQKAANDVDDDYNDLLNGGSEPEKGANVPGNPANDEVHEVPEGDQVDETTQKAANDVDDDYNQLLEQD